MNRYTLIFGSETEVLFIDLETGMFSDCLCTVVVYVRLVKLWRVRRYTDNILVEMATILRLFIVLFSFIRLPISSSTHMIIPSLNKRNPESLNNPRMSASISVKGGCLLGCSSMLSGRRLKRSRGPRSLQFHQPNIIHYTTAVQYRRPTSTVYLRF